MKREEYLSGIFKVFSVVSVLSEKDGKTVMRVRHRQLEKDMAIRSYRRRVPAYDFLCGYSHINIPAVYDTYEAEDGQIVLEEFIDGVTVNDVLKTGLYKYRGAKEVLKQVCSALGFMHENGFVHRDIKPGNIMITADGICKLIDFDVSRTVADDKNSDTYALGTLGYAPPEQYGIAQSDARSDIYALGVLLNVMLTGKHPSERLASGKAGRIVIKSTQISPEERFHDVRVFRDAL